MKNSIRFIGIITALVLVAVSCGKKPSHINVIPDNAYGVIVVKPSQTNSKKLQEQFEANEDFQEVLQTLKEEKPELAQIFEDFTKDPTSLGIDLNQEAYAFISSDEEQDFVASAFALKKASKFKDFVQTILEEMEINMEIETDENLNILAFPMDVGYITWDNEKALILVFMKGEGEAKELSKKLMTQKAGNSIMQNKDFQTFYNNRLDLNVWVSSNIDKLEDEIAMAEKFLGFDINDNFAHLHLGWDKKSGEFTTILKLRVNKEIRNMDYKDIQEILETSGLKDEIENKIHGRSSYYGDEYYDEYLEGYEGYDEGAEYDEEELTEEEMQMLLEEIEDASNEE